jgi:hypothetical protein
MRVTLLLGLAVTVVALAAGRADGGHEFSPWFDDDAGWFIIPTSPVWSFGSEQTLAKINPGLSDGGCECEYRTKKGTMAKDNGPLCLAVCKSLQTK